MLRQFRRKFDNWISFAVLLTMAGFMAWFVVSEADGWRALGEWLLDAVRLIPDFFSGAADHYTSLPFGQIAPSLLTGALLGGLLTGARALPGRRMPLTFVWLGFIVLALTLYAGGRLLLALVLGVGAILLLSFVVDARFREWLASQAASAEGRAAFGRGALIGGVVGGLSSQILTYPLQHCTFAPEAPAIQHDIGLAITLVSTVILLIPTWTALFQSGALASQVGGGYFRGRGLAYVLLLPTLLVLIVFLYFPGVQMILLSLNRQRFPLPQAQFVCLENYVALKDDVIYRNSIFTTAFITVLLVILTMALALMIAVLASQKIKGAGVYRTLLIWPFALSPVITGFIFLSMFREGGAGIINYFLDDLFGISPHWLRDSSLAPWVIILAAVWNGLGFNILFYIAGLQNVPDDLLDAAAIDGANVVQRFIRVTLPAALAVHVLSARHQRDLRLLRDLRRRRFDHARRASAGAGWHGGRRDQHSDLQAV